MRIGTNSAADNAVNRLNKVTSKLEKNSAQLSSGKRIISAAVDAAGLAIAKELETEVRLADQARRNIGSGVGAIEIANGVLGTVANIDIERAELAEQAATGTLSPSNRQALDAQYQALGEERSRVLASAEYNGEQLFQAGGSSFSVQVGTSGAATDRISVAISSSGGSSGNLLTQAAAQAALDESKAQVAATSQAVGTLSAFTNRLDVADSNLTVSSLNYASARSQIEDLDFATALAERSGLKIQQQAALAVAAQANQQPLTVLKLLTG